MLKSRTVNELLIVTTIKEQLIEVQKTDKINMTTSDLSQMASFLIGHDAALDWMIHHFNDQERDLIEETKSDD